MKLQIGNAFILEFAIDDSEELSRNPLDNSRRFILYGHNPRLSESRSIRCECAHSSSFPFHNSECERMKKKGNIELVISEEEAKMLDINLEHLLARD